MIPAQRWLQESLEYCRTTTTRSPEALVALESRVMYRDWCLVKGTPILALQAALPGTIQEEDCMQEEILGHRRKRLSATTGMWD